MPKKKPPVSINVELTPAEWHAVAHLIREHVRTTRSVLADSVEPLKSTYAKLVPEGEPAPTPRTSARPLGLMPSRRR